MIIALCSSQSERAKITFGLITRDDDDKVIAAAVEKAVADINRRLDLLTDVDLKYIYFSTDQLQEVTKHNS